MNRKVERTKPVIQLKCLRSDWPLHLIPGEYYFVDLQEKDKQNEFATYESSKDRYYIGNFPINCFDMEPVKKWIAEHRGVQNERADQQVRKRSNIHSKGHGEGQGRIRKAHR